MPEPFDLQRLPFGCRSALRAPSLSGRTQIAFTQERTPEVVPNSFKLSTVFFMIS